MYAIRSYYVSLLKPLMLSILEKYLGVCIRREDPDIPHLLLFLVFTQKHSESKTLVWVWLCLRITSYNVCYTKLLRVAVTLVAALILMFDRKKG